MENQENCLPGFQAGKVDYPMVLQSVYKSCNFLLGKDIAVGTGDKLANGKHDP